MIKLLFTPGLFYTRQPSVRLSKANQKLIMLIIGFTNA